MKRNEFSLVTGHMLMRAATLLVTIIFIQSSFARFTLNELASCANEYLIRTLDNLFGVCHEVFEPKML